MTRALELDELLVCIDEKSPSGNDLRYTSCYEEIMEARRCEDAIALGDWRHDVKSADWEKAVQLCVAALRGKSKDLQICAWLTEALTVVDGFVGLDLGLRLMAGVLERFWESLYPLSEDGDLEYRAAPFEFLNEKVTLQVRLVPVTDKSVTPGYSWQKWRESRSVGFDADTRNRFGDVDEEKKRRREELLAEKGVAAEEFDAAVARSSGPYARALVESLERCQKSLRALGRVAGERFGSAAPSLAELEEAVEGCTHLVQRVYGAGAAQAEGERQPEPSPEKAAPPAVRAVAGVAACEAAGEGEREGSLWGEALVMLEAGELHGALSALLCGSNSAESTRDKNRVRLLMAKLCLKAQRPDLARPIVEELHQAIEELHLERWESPLWIAEVLDAYYQCLQAGAAPDEDLNLSRALLRRICSLDVTRALQYRN